MGCLPLRSSPSGFAFNNTNYQNSNANAGDGSRKC